MNHIPDPSTEELSLRLAELELAVRLHEETTSRPAVPKRPSDHELYRQLKRSGDGGLPPNGGRDSAKR